jgi:4-amino-4-deoxy-L-arabinose transferase-like glycosyltransferase
LPLFGDEAFYWLESRRLAAGYDDVPALTPWLIAAGTLFGHSEFAVRLPFVLLGAFTAWWAARIAANAFGQAAGGWAGATALLLPLFAANGLLALPDVPLTLAVLCCAEALRRLVESDGRVGRLLLAIGLALGWLSHYRFLLAFAAGGAWMLLDRRGRGLLRDAAVWRSGLAGSALGLAPLLWQQWRHGAHGLLFQFDERHPWRFQPEGLADPLLQALAVTPPLAVVLAAVLVAAWRRRRDPCFATWGGLAAWMLLGLMLLAPFVDTERSRLHWPLPAWVLLALLLPAAAARWSTAVQRALQVAAAVAVIGVAGVFGWLVLVASSPERLAASALYPENFRGWAETGAAARSALAAAPADTVLAADNFKLAAALSFELGGRPVLSLDHPINRKHGRQAELARRGLDEQALVAAAVDRPVLLVIDESASRLRERPGWYRRACTLLPRAQPRFDLAVDHGAKRFIGYLQTAAAGSCAPPPLAYLHEPIAGARVASPFTIEGWALRDRVGIGPLWLAVDGVRVAPIAYGAPHPGVAALFPDSDDPRHPDVGFLASVSLPPGRYWIAVETDGAPGVRSVLASIPITVR